MDADGNFAAFVNGVMSGRLDEERNTLSIIESDLERGLRSASFAFGERQGRREGSMSKRSSETSLFVLEGPRVSDEFVDGVDEVDEGEEPVIGVAIGVAIRKGSKEGSLGERDLEGKVGDIESGGKGKEKGQPRLQRIWAAKRMGLLPKTRLERPGWI